MILFVCLDDRNGLGFNKRRQSRDSRVLEDMLNIAPGKLVIDPFSEKLLQEAGVPYTLAPEDLSTLPEEACFFLENRDASTASLASKIVIYRWNRHYPADVRWDPDLGALGFSLESTGEFPGSSHKIITREVYVK